MAKSKTTTDHDTIRNWAEQRDGHPAAVKGTGSAGDAGLLRIDFADAEADPELQPIEWNEFFQKFDESGLEFLYQDRTEDGEISRFCKFVNKPR
jgi:hypothetical protein